MDHLINMLEKFAVTQNEDVFNNSVDKLTDFYKLNIKDFDSSEEWEHLKKNYSNLRYINELLHHYNYSLNKNFYDLLSLFMESIDKTTQDYIKNIHFSNDLSEEIEIKKYFNRSLNTNDINDKILYVLEAYKILVPIIEDFRQEKYDYSVDRNFKERFSSKRLKLK